MAEDQVLTERAMASAPDACAWPDRAAEVGHRTPATGAEDTRSPVSRSAEVEVAVDAALDALDRLAS